MGNMIRRLILCTLVAGCTLSAFGQTDSLATDTVFMEKKAPPRVQKKLVLLGAGQAGDIITVNYECPYTGMAEFTLVDATGKRIYFNQYPSKIGPGAIRLKRGAFKAAGTYTYVIRYKDEEYKGTIEIG